MTQQQCEVGHPVRCRVRQQGSCRPKAQRASRILAVLARSGRVNRNAREAMLLAMRDHAAIALHHQISTWAMKSGLKLQPRTDEYTLAGSLSLQRP